MAGVARIQIAKPDIIKLFDERNQKVYRIDELAEILHNYSRNWRLTVNQSVAGFVDFLTKRSILHQIELKGPNDSLKRYVWGSPNVYAIALSLHKNAYLSHGTAVFLHGVTDQIPKTIFVNHEQSPKPKKSAPLTQDLINAAFKNPVRISHAVYTSGNNLQIQSINGMYTGRLEVGNLTDPYGSQVEATKLERTLIDIVVRPNYAGGVFQVLQAFRAALPRISVNLMMATLKHMDYAYPYHQCIGFYLERAGFEEPRIEYFRKMPKLFDFYLAHGLGETEYDKRWRLFYPKGM